MLLRAALIAFGLLAPGQAAAENFALLVGASTYPYLDEEYWLYGPANDVRLVRDYLTQSAPVPFREENILLLADGVEGAGAPTLNGIRAGFAALAPRVEPGDFVYLHFSGHGSQAPALRPGTEVDGLDELFLPTDIGLWSDEVGAVQNALVDDEIGALIGSLRARGASVWAVFDACHSGTITRAAGVAAGEAVRPRRLSPLALGVPDDALTYAAPTPRGLRDPRARPPAPLDVEADRDADQQGGGLVAFFAAQTTETTPEERLPRGMPGRRSQGVFTFTLFEALAAHPGITYRQLGQEVLRRYGVQNLASATPMFEGDLDDIVFAGTKGAPVRQWPVAATAAGPMIRAGRLHGLSSGTLMTLLPDAASAGAAAIGHARVGNSDTFRAALDLIAHDGLPALDPETLPQGVYARQAERVIDYTLRVAAPDGFVPPQVADALRLAETRSPARIAFVPTGAPADIRLALIPNRQRSSDLWMLPASGVADAGPPPMIRLGGRPAPKIVTALQDNLTAMSKAVNLMRMAGRYDATDLDVALTLRTRTPPLRTLRDLDASTVPVLLPGDEVHIEARNQAAFPVDINVLRISARYEISHFAMARLNPGDALRQGLYQVTGTDAGRDRVLVVMSPAAPRSHVQDLRFLQQPSVPTLRGRQGSGSFTRALMQAGFGTEARRTARMGGDAGPSPSMLLFDIDTAPGG